MCEDDEKEKVYDNPLMMESAEYDKYMREKYEKENLIESED